MSLIPILATLGGEDKLPPPVITKSSDTSDIQLGIYATESIAVADLKSITVDYTDTTVSPPIAYTKTYTTGLSDLIDSGIVITNSITANHVYKVVVTYKTIRNRTVSSNILLITAVIDPTAFTWQTTADTGKKGWTSVENGLSTFVMVGDNGLIGYTTDCKTVTVVSSITGLPSGTLLSSLNFTRVAYKGTATVGAFIALAITGEVLRSTDGKAWTYITTLSLTKPEEKYYALNSGNGVFAAVSSGGPDLSFTPAVSAVAAVDVDLYVTAYTSTDGTVWDKKHFSSLSLRLPKNKYLTYIKTIIYDGYNWCGMAGTSFLFSTDFSSIIDKPSHNVTEYISLSNDGKYFMSTCINGGHITPYIRISSTSYRDASSVAATNEYSNSAKSLIASPLISSIPGKWANNKNVNGVNILIPAKTRVGLKATDPFSLNPDQTDAARAGYLIPKDTIWFADDYTDILDYRDIAFGTIKSKSGLVDIKMYTLVANAPVTGTATDKLIKYSRA